MVVKTAEEYRQEWERYLAEGGEPPVYPSPRSGVASSVHNRKLKAEQAKAKRVEKGVRLRLRKTRV